MAASSAEATAEVRFVRNAEGIYFDLGRSRSNLKSKENEKDKFGNYTLYVKQGLLDMTDKHLVRIILDPGPYDAAGFTAAIIKILKAFIREDGTLDVDAYLNSEFYRNFPPAEARLIEKRRAAAELEEYEKHLAATNKERRRVGLPPLPSRMASKSGFKKESEFADDPSPTGGPETDRAKPKPNRKTLEQIRRSEQLKIGETNLNIEETVLYLLHPDARPGISRHGEKVRRRMVMDSMSRFERIRNEMRERNREMLHQKRVPDATLSSGEFGRVRPYLIASLDLEDFTTADYDILPGFEFGQQDKFAKLKFNKSTAAGLAAIFCPPGYRPVGYFHPKGEIKGLQFTGNLERNVFALSLPHKVEKGLTIYFRKLKSHADTTEPVVEDRRPRLNMETLTEPWRNLLAALAESPLNEKAKADIIIRAWSQRGFVYDDTDACYRQYDGYGAIDSPEFYSAILNLGNGNCGYAERGWLGAASAAGLAVHGVTSYLAGPNGNFSLRENLHGIVQVFIKDQWVLVEPQVGYLTPGYDLEEIPEVYRDKFTRLIKAIPKADVLSPQRLTALPGELLNLTSEDYLNLIEIFILQLQAELREFTGSEESLSLKDIAALFTSSVDMYGKRRAALALVKYGGIALVGTFALQQLAPHMSEITRPVFESLHTLLPALLPSAAAPAATAIPQAVAPVATAVPQIVAEATVRPNVTQELIRQVADKMLPILTPLSYLVVGEIWHKLRRAIEKRRGHSSANEQEELEPEYDGTSDYIDVPAILPSMKQE